VYWLVDKDSDDNLGWAWRPFPNWPKKKRWLLCQLVVDFIAKGTGLPPWGWPPPEWQNVIADYPPPNYGCEGGGVYAHTYLKYADAQALYFSLVAQTLRAELAAPVSWSITDSQVYGEEELDVLLNGLHMFHCIVRLCPDDGCPNFMADTVSTLPPPDVGWCGQNPIFYESVPPGFPEQQLYLQLSDKAHPMPMAQAHMMAYVLPDYGPLMFEWLVENNMLKATRLETILAVLEWCRDHLRHYSQGNQVELKILKCNLAEYFWGYGGAPPVFKVLEGTDPVGPIPDSSVPSDFPYAHWILGCHGVVALLKALLRTANIPVFYLTPTECGHGGACFPTEGKLLPHGDDIYAKCISSGLPVSAFLVDVDSCVWSSAYPCSWPEEC
jgi:hypothetical protein